MNSVFVIYSQDIRSGKIKLYAVAKTEELAQSKIEEIKEDAKCKDLTNEDWNNLVERMKIIARSKNWDIPKDQYVTIIYNYVTSQYPIHILIKAQKAYQESKYIQYFINEVDYYES